jgi:hypothetical protein
MKPGSLVKISPDRYDVRVFTSLNFDKWEYPPGETEIGMCLNHYDFTNHIQILFPSGIRWVNKFDLETVK